MLALTDGLHCLFSVPGTAASNLREFGMSLTARIEPLKRELARRAMGV